LARDWFAHRGKRLQTSIFLAIKKGNGHGSAGPVH
jgi:hypothetical protein